MSSSSSTTTPLQRPHSSYLETSSFYGTHIPSNIRRRKRKTPENWAKCATKCVLASPLIVLVLWSVAVMSHSSSKKNVQSTLRTSTSNVLVEPEHKADANILPFYVPLGGQEQFPVIVPLGQQQSTVVVRPRPHPRSPMTQGENSMQNTQGGSAMINTQGGNVMMRTESSGNAMMRTENGGNAMTTTEDGGNDMMRTENGGNDMMRTENGGNIMMRTENGGNAMMTTESSGNAMMTTESSGNDMMQNNAMMTNTQGMMTNTQGMMTTQGSNIMTTSENAQNNMQNTVMMMNTKGNNAMTRNDNVMTAIEIAENALANTQGNAALMNTQGMMLSPGNAAFMKTGNARMNIQDNAAMMNTQGSTSMMAAEINVHPTKRTRILYYDPAVGTETVYDADGTPILLSSLQTGNTEIYLQKPLLGVTEHAAPPRELEYEWGESQAQDQMIIVSTVATMALLVGALSARRLRSRQFLASCIENESLEDEVAYDTAYTTNGYDTFGGGPWKGDLEKFDV